MKNIAVVAILNIVLSVCVQNLNAQEVQTIGHQLLRLEAEVTNSTPPYSKLDEILDKVLADIESEDVLSIQDESERAKSFFKTVANTLRKNGYYHQYTYPATLTEVFSSSPTLFDCDTGSFIYLSAANRLNLPIAMVEVEIGGNPGEREFGDHNFVRWKLRNGKEISWDVNGEYFRTNDIKTAQYGFSWNDDQLKGYVYFLRGIQWRKRNLFNEAIEDYKLSIKYFPLWAKARNNLAWLYSTVEDIQSDATKVEALELAIKVVELNPSVNNRDTLACVYAINGNFSEATRIQSKVVEEDNSVSFKNRLLKFEKKINCLGDI